MTTPGATGACCPEGALPALEYDYKPKGEHFELPGVDTRASAVKLYVVGASQSDASWSKGPVSVLLCDAFGPFSGMHRKLADEFASQTGGIALLPDPFEGSGGLVPQYGDEDDKPNQLGFNIFTWNTIASFIWSGKSFMKRYPWEGNLEYLFKDQLLPFLKTKGVEQFSLIGFCYGTWMACKACSDEIIVEHVTCAIHFHPSVELVEKAHGKDDLALCSTCKRPQMLHATKNESTNWKPEGAAHQLLKENENVPEVQFTLAPSSQNHGFMTRVDMSQEANKAAVKEGVDLAVAFLKKHNSKN